MIKLLICKLLKRLQQQRHGYLDRPILVNNEIDNFRVVLQFWKRSFLIIIWPVGELACRWVIYCKYSKFNWKTEYTECTKLYKHNSKSTSTFGVASSNIDQFSHLSH